MPEVTRLKKNRPAVAGLAMAGLVVAIAAAAVATSRLPGTRSADTSSARATAASLATPVAIRWFVGLGTGLAPDQLAAEKAFVARYNATNTDGITLKLDNPQEIIPDADPYDVLKTQIASGNAPDIIGPVGLSAMNPFEGLFANLNPQIAANHVDLAVFEPRILQLLRQDGAQVGLPYTVNPGFIFYNKDLFEQAGLPPLPTVVGQTYMGKTWDWNELATVASRLTLDGSGRHEAQPGFDPNAIAQFGFDFPVADARVMASTFGPGSFVADDEIHSQVSPVWVDAFGWYRRAMWTSHIAPTGPQESSALLGSGHSIASGHVAMALSFPSDIASYGSPGNAALGAWGAAVIPSWKGTTTSPVGVTTFALVKSRYSAVDLGQAFKTMLAIESDASLRAVYGGMPGSSAQQAAWFASQQSTQSTAFPGNQVDWSVLPTMERYAALPAAEANMPSLRQITADYTAFFAELRNASNLNLDAALCSLRQKVQIDLDNAMTGPADAEFPATPRC